jgi:hypothetical protein
MDVRAALAMAESRDRSCQLAATDLSCQKRAEPPSSLLQHAARKIATDKSDSKIVSTAMVVSSDEDEYPDVSRHTELDNLAQALIEPADHVLRNWGQMVDKDLARAGARTDAGMDGETDETDTADTDDLAGMVWKPVRKRKKKAKKRVTKAEADAKRQAAAAKRKIAATKRASTATQGPSPKKAKRAKSADNDDDDDDNDDDDDDDDDNVWVPKVEPESAVETNASGRPQRRRQSVTNTSGVSEVDLKDLDSMMSSSLEDLTDPDDVWQPGTGGE